MTPDDYGAIVLIGLGVLIPLGMILVALVIDAVRREPQDDEDTYEMIWRDG